MKKLLSIILVTVMIMTLIVPLSASAVGTSLEVDKSVVRAGDTLKVTYRVSEKIEGFEARISYDSNVLTLDKVSKKCAWSSFSVNGDKVVAWADSSSAAEANRMFTVTFKVKDGVAVDTTANIKVEGTVKEAGKSSDSPASATTSVKVGDKLSDENKLEALEVVGYKLSPSFSPNVTSYAIENVPYDVSSLNVKASAVDDDAKINITGKNLDVGVNTVKVNVTAPNGDVKTYKINVEREQDPNYIASGDCELSGIEASDGKLSPNFNPAVHEYVLYVPYETVQISLKGDKGKDKKKTVTDVEGQSLNVGTNEATVTVAAEDGSTGAYKVYVVRMDQFGGANTLGVPASLIKPEETTAKDEPIVAEDNDKSGVSPIVIVLVAFIAILVGFVIGMLIFKNKGNDDSDDSDDSYGNPNDYLDVESYGSSSYTSSPDEYIDISSSSNNFADIEYDEPAPRRAAKRSAPKRTASKKPAPKMERNVPSADKSKDRQRATLKQTPSQQSSTGSERIQYIDYQTYIDNLDK